MHRRDFLATMAATSVIPAVTAAAQTGRASEAHSVSSHSFPPEWGPHEAIWMGWYEYVTYQPEHVTLRLAMLNALTPHVQVRMIVRDEASAEQIAAIITNVGLSLDQIVFHIQPVVDVWTRDCGPLFVSNGKTLELAAFEWGNYGFPWPLTDPRSLERGQLDQQVGERMGVHQRTSSIIAEGGGLEVNSRTLVTYRDVIMHRNPGVELSVIESELKRLYGKEQVIFLDRAPITDRVLQGPKIANFFGWGANGHVDEYVRFVSEDTILVGEVSEAERDRDPLMRLDHEILAENRQQLEEARDPDGNPFNVVPMPVPDVGPFLKRRTLTEDDFATDGSKWLFNRDFAVGDEVIDVPAVSYLNFLVTNGVVLSAKYGGEGRPAHLAESDAKAAAILGRYFPDREIVQIDPLAANWDGGGMHCLTQQEPRI